MIGSWSVYEVVKLLDNRQDSPAEKSSTHSGVAGRIDCHPNPGFLPGVICY